MIVKEKFHSLLLVISLVLAGSTLVWSGAERVSIEKKYHDLLIVTDSLKKENSQLLEDVKSVQEDCGDALDLRESEVAYYGRLFEKMKEQYPAQAEAIRRSVRKEMGFE